MAAAEDCEEPRCLSIQSHVVAGYVGNKSATFPLQLLGVDVCPVNSVQFSNHTGYRQGIKGQVLNGEQLLDLLEGLRANSLLHFSHVLTGYIGSDSFLSAVLQVLSTVREVAPNAQYVCDPVLGDHGKLYVPESLVKVYREQVLPVATTLTPNQFEAELLSGVEVVDVPSLLEACGALHSAGVHRVIVTSTDLDAASFPPDTIPTSLGPCMVAVVSCPWADVADSALKWSDITTPHAACVATHSTLPPTCARRPQGACMPPHSASHRFGICIPRMEGSFTGTGDLTAALLLAHMHSHKTDMVHVALQAIRTVHVRGVYVNAASQGTLDTCTPARPCTGRVSAHKGAG